MNRSTWGEYKVNEVSAEAAYDKAVKAPGQSCRFETA